MMLKRVLFNIFIASLVFLMQINILSNFEVAGIKPNLILIFLVTNMLLKKDNLIVFIQTVYLSILIESIFNTKVLVIYLLIIFFIYKIQNIVRNEILFYIFVIGISEIIYLFKFYVFEILLEKRVDFIFYFFRIMMPDVVYTVLLSIIVYFIIRKKYDR